MRVAKEQPSFLDKARTLSGQCWVPSGIFLMRPRFAFLAYPFLLVVWFVAGTQSYAAVTSDSSKSATQEVLEHHQNATRSGLFVAPSLTWDRAVQGIFKEAGQ